MRLASICPRDIVLVDKRGRRFYALVTGAEDRTLELSPLDRRISYFTARPREVIGHWRRAGRSCTRRGPSGGDRQLELQARDIDQKVRL